LTGPSEPRNPPEGRADRVHCDHAARCGGCTLLPWSKAEQAALKQRSVRAAFERYPALGGLSVDAVVGAEPNVEYRTRAKLMVAPDGGVGLYERGTHSVLDIPHCRVLSPTVARVVAQIRLLSRAAPGVLSAIDVRETQDAGRASALVTLMGESGARARLERIAAQVARIEAVIGVAISARARDAKTLLGAAPVVFAGVQAARDSLVSGGPFHLASHGGFVQAHRGQAAAIALRLERGLQAALGDLAGARILELYAGSGAVGLRLAQRGARPLLIERFAPALALARQAAALQGLPALETIAGDAATVLSDLSERAARYDAAVVNPPRSGLPAMVRSKLAQLAPTVIAYVSCDAVTMARDLDHFARLGYASARIEPFDMMPHTASVECFALLTQAAPAAVSVLFDAGELLAVDKPPHLPTTPQSEFTHSLLASVREQLGIPTLTPVHRLDQGTSGVCLLAKHTQAVAELAAALKAGEKRYVALARGITRRKGSVQRPLADRAGRRDARTRYQRTEVLAGHSLLQVRPDEGRTHQIRRHLAAIGHPVLGDARYGDPKSNRHLELRHGLDRTFLHLGQLDLEYPRGTVLRLSSALPGDLAGVCDRLRGLDQT
jgi:23S rRNA (uracil1939-C5)-methyltransferase